MPGWSMWTFIFQFTPPRRGRPEIYGEIAQREISIHAPAKGATGGSVSVPTDPWDFNSRPREGGDFCLVQTLYNTCYFNSRPREGGDTASMLRQASRQISIHAPAKGATPLPATGSISLAYFNSRPREGGDLCCLQSWRGSSFQFTPPRRGRRINPQPVADLINFNSRPREGGDRAV